MSNANCPFCGSEPTPELKGAGGTRWPGYACGTNKNGSWRSELCNERRAHNQTKRVCGEMIDRLRKASVEANTLRDIAEKAIDWLKRGNLDDKRAARYILEKLEQIK